MHLHSLPLPTLLPKTRSPPNSRLSSLHDFIILLFPFHVRRTRNDNSINIDFFTKVSANAYHSKWARGRRIQRCQLLNSEIFRQQEYTNGDKEEDDDWEAYCGDRLRDREGGAETDEFEGDEEPDGLLSLKALEWVRARSQDFIASEVEKFVGDTVCLQCLDSHDEEEACKDTTGNEV